MLLRKSPAITRESTRLSSGRGFLGKWQMSWALRDGEKVAKPGRGGQQKHCPGKGGAARGLEVKAVHSIWSPALVCDLPGSPRPSPLLVSAVRYPLMVSSCLIVCWAQIGSSAYPKSGPDHQPQQKSCCQRFSIQWLHGLQRHGLQVAVWSSSGALQGNDRECPLWMGTAV